MSVRESPDLPTRTEVRFGTPEDAGAYAALMRLAFGDVQPYELRYRWQYWSDPQHSKLLVFEADDNVAGMLGVEMRPLTNGLVSGVIRDIVVTPQHRRRGVLRRLCGEANRLVVKRGGALLASFVNAAAASALARVAGWQILTPIPVLRRDVRAELPRTRVSEGLLAREVVAFDRNRQNRVWRFDQHPVHEYFTASFRTGIAVMKLFGDPPSGDIVDVNAVPLELEVLEGTYRAAVERLRTMGAHEAVTWGILPASERDLLSRLGWQSGDASRSFAVSVLRPEAKSLADASGWRLQPADIEHF